MNDPRLALAGLVTGVLVGMTGMGGGSLMTPILIFFFNFNPSAAIGTDILHGTIFKSFGAVRHRRLGTVRARLGAWMAWGRPGVSPRHLGGDLPDRPLRGRRRLRQGRVLGYTLLFGAVVRGQGAHAPRRVGGDPRASEQARPTRGGIDRRGRRLHRRPHLGRERDALRARHAARLPLAAKFVVGTDIFHAAALLLVAGLGHLVAGNVDVPAIGWLLVGSIPGVLIGSQISVGLPETGLRMALATALALSG